MSCSIKLSIKDDLVGKTIKCPKCGMRFAVAAVKSLAARRTAAAHDSPSAAELPGDSPPIEGITVSFRAGSDTEPKELAPAGDLPEVPGYRVLHEIARGGMGRVLAAHDVSLDRKVAIKIVLPGSSADRFIRESKITARLPHPGIPPVHALGTLADGSPFLAMKLIAGHTLAVEMKNCSGLEGRPRLLRAFMQVCQAVGFAHSRGVIHRDLKPGNVMVGAFGEVQVMDWGLAKVVTGHEGPERPPLRSANSQKDADANRADDDELSDDRTQAGTLLGTPSYMAPEQARGEAIDARADVFALGGILCAILTGLPPFHASSAKEVIRLAAAGDLAEARKRLNRCGADLELIDLTKRCLAPRAGDRLKDGQAVAEAIAEYLEAVQKRLDEARLAEAEAKARAVEERKRRRVTMALAATVLLALTLGGGGWLWVKADRDFRLTQVTRDMSDALTKATGFRDLARSANDDGAPFIAQAREQVQRALALSASGPVDDGLTSQLAQLKSELDELKSEFDDKEKDRSLVADLDAAKLEQAEIVGGELRFARERAVPKFREAFRVYGLPVGEGDPTATAERIRRRPAPIRAAIVAALDDWLSLAAKPKLGIQETHADWLMSVAVAVEPSDGWTRQFRAARDEKDPALRREALENLAAKTDVEKLPASSVTLLANSLTDQQAHAIALRLLRQAQTRHPENFWVNFDLGQALLQAKPAQREEAVRYLTAAVAMRPKSAGVHNSLGIALAALGQLEGAINSYRSAIALDPNLAMAHSNLGLSLGKTEKVDEAVACFQKAIAIDPKLAGAYINLGLVLTFKGKADEGIGLCRQAVALDPNYAEAHSALGSALKIVRNLDEAIASYRAAIALDAKQARFHNFLGIALQDKGMPTEAIASFQQAVAVDPGFVDGYNRLGLILILQKKYDDAITCYRQALAVNPKAPMIHTALGVVLNAKGQKDEAVVHYRLAIALDPKNFTAHVNLGLTLTDKGRFEEAVVYFRQALALNPADASVRTHLARAEQSLKQAK